MVYETTIGETTFIFNKNVDPKEIESMVSIITTEMEACMHLKKSVEEWSNVFAEKKKSLETLFDKYAIKEVKTKDISTTHGVSTRFSRYSDEDAVLELIPNELQNLSTMSLDRKKINKLIDENELPIEIKVLEIQGDPIHRMTFQVPGEKKHGKSIKKD